MENKSNADFDSEDLSFEQAISRLDETVRALETGGLPLAEATRLFEEGMKLARLSNKLLASAELRITRIQTAFGEQMRMVEQEQTARQEDEFC